MMAFEDEFMDKISEIISLYAKRVDKSVSKIYLYIYNDEAQSTLTYAFKKNDKLVFFKEAGLSEEQDNDFYDIIFDEILPELEDICINSDRPMPFEMKIQYNLNGKVDVKCKYKDEIAKNYDCDREGYNWIHSFE